MPVLRVVVVVDAANSTDPFGYHLPERLLRPRQSDERPPSKSIANVVVARRVDHRLRRPRAKSKQMSDRLWPIQCESNDERATTGVLMTRTLPFEEALRVSSGVISCNHIDTLVTGPISQLLRATVLPRMQISGPNEIHMESSWS